MRTASRRSHVAAAREAAARALAEEQFRQRAIRTAFAVLVHGK